ncbi:MAG: rod shape-determining protein RodA [Nitrospirota bacterium]
MIRIDRRLAENFDWITFLIVILITILGIMTIYSATRPAVEGEQPGFYLKQILWLILGIVALFLIVKFDYIWLSRFSLLFYIGGILLLICVSFFGKKGMGAQRWLNLGIISFQPSEFFRLIYIIMLSQCLSITKSPFTTKSFLRIFLSIVFIPFILLLKQPDLGTALMIVGIFISLIFIKGLQKRLAILLVVIGLISVPFVGNILWEGLEDYQKSRLVAFIKPGADPKGIGYHQNQSKITIGSGKFFGKGYLQGTQGPFRFLPEKHTDFIFAVFAEEWGFWGSLILLFLYFIVILRGIETADMAKDEFGRVLAFGITFMFLIYFFVNVGMTLSMIPVVGLPLPFMSYGGTALLSNFIAIGILINIRMRRFELFH